MKWHEYIKECEENNREIDHGYILQDYEGVDQEYLEKYCDELGLNLFDIFKTYKIKDEYLHLIADNTKNFSFSLVNIECQKLSIDFYKKHKDKFYLSYFLIHQKLSENDINEIFDDIIYHNILDNLFVCQILSESFLHSIKEHWIDNDYLKGYLVNYNKLSDDFRKEFDLSRYLWDENWLYKSTEFKKEKLIKTNNYECFEDYFIAYKAIRPDRYSLYDFQYQYLENGIYQAKANYNIDEISSFGLSVGTKERCEYYGVEYGDYDAKACIIIECKIYYDDIAAIVHDGDEIRCAKIEILE